MGRSKAKLKVVEEQPQGLPNNQKKFIALLLTGMTISDAANAAGVSRSFAFQQMADPHSEIYYEYVTARLEKQQAFSDRMAQLHEKALSAMEASLSEEAPPAVRFAAAKFIYSAHLQSSGSMAHAFTPDTLVDKEISRYRDAINHHNSVVVARYDSKGQPRMTYEEYCNDAFE